MLRRLRTRDRGVRLMFCPSPYGGTPGAFAEGPWGTRDDALAYWAAIREELDEDIEVFWTGDGGVFSPQVTAQGADAFAEAVGRKPFVWDNDALICWEWVRPATGRDAALAEHTTGIVANVNEHEAGTPQVGKFALATFADYAWNPEGYAGDIERAYRHFGGPRWEAYRRTIEAGRGGFSRYAGFPRTSVETEAADWRLIAAAMGSRSALDRTVAGIAAERLARLERCLAIGIWADAPVGNDPTQAVDGDARTAWNAMRGAPAWIELRFEKPRRIGGVRLLVEQQPEGETTHEVRIDGEPVWTFEGKTKAGDLLEASFEPPIVGSLVRIDTVRSPSWVAWREIQLVD